MKTKTIAILALLLGVAIAQNPILPGGDLSGRPTNVDVRELHPYGTAAETNTVAGPNDPQGRPTPAPDSDLLIWTHPTPKVTNTYAPEALWKLHTVSRYVVDPAIIETIAELKAALAAHESDAPLTTGYLPMSAEARAKALTGHPDRLRRLIAFWEKYKAEVEALNDAAGAPAK